MSHEAYPVTADLTTFLEDAGLTTSTSGQRDAAIAAILAHWNRSTGYTPWLAEASNSARLVEATSCNYVILPTGYVSIAQVLTGVRTSLIDNLTGGTLPVISYFTPANAAPGVAVTIYGAGFTGATAVKFNGVSVAPTSITGDTTILATVPAGGSMASVEVVTTPGSFTLSGTLAYAGVDYRPQPYSGTPIVGLNLLRYGCGPLLVVGKQGYSADVPDDVWQGLLSGAAAIVSDNQGGAANTGVSKWTLGPVSGEYSGKSNIREDGWKAAYMGILRPPYVRLGF